MSSLGSFTSLGELLCRKDVVNLLKAAIADLITPLLALDDSVGWSDPDSELCEVRAFLPDDGPVSS